MSTTIDTNFVDVFSRNLQILSQQKGTRLRRTVQQEPPVNGSRFSVDQVGKAVATAVTVRHGATPSNDPPSTRRWGNMTAYGYGAMIDSADKVRLLIDPQASYTRNGIYALGRALDDVIISAATGAASSGHDGSGSTVFDANNVLPAGSGGATAVTATGLTVDKLISAKELLTAANVDPDEPMYLICKAKQISDLLGTTQVTSIWYNSVKALVEGKIDRFMGFNFVTTERLQSDVNTNDMVLAYSQSGIALGEAEMLKVSVAPDPSHRFSIQIYAEAVFGAVRTEEAKIVQILCNPTL